MGNHSYKSLCWQGSFAVGIAAALSYASAGVSTDGTSGSSVTLPGPHYAITADLGRRVGPNLLHSFNRFDLAAGESATFSGPTSVRHIVARVTGGSASNINGLLRSDIAGANLFLINPSGVVFGPAAEIDVGGSFAVSTADYIRLADGTRLTTSAAEPPVLTAASPAAFGFLSPPGAGISIDSARINGAPGKAVFIAGGDLSLIRTRIRAGGGAIHILSTASPGEWAFDLDRPLDPSTGQFDGALGRVALTDTLLSASPGGRVAVRGADLSMVRSGIFADTENQAGSAVDIELTGQGNLTAGSIISASTSGSGNAGGVLISSAGLLLTEGSQVRSDTGAGGEGGRIRIVAGMLRAEGRGPVQAPLLDETPLPSDLRGSGIQTAALPGSTSRGGDIEITATKVDLISGGRITAGTLGAGNGGHIRIASNELSLDGAGADRPEVTGIYSGVSLSLVGGGIEIAGDAPVPTGAGGDIFITAGSVGRPGAVRVVRGAQIDASTDGAGNAGRLTLVADSLLLDGGGSKYITGLDSGATLATATAFQRTGKGGNPGSTDVTVTGEVLVRDGALMQAATFGPGTGGTLNLHAGSIVLDGNHSGLFTGLFTSTVGPVGGKGGKITVKADGLLAVRNGAVITASTLSNSPGGDMEISAGHIELSREFVNFQTALVPFFARAFNVDVTETQKTLALAGMFGLDLGEVSKTIDNGGEIGAQSFLNGPAGNVTLRTGRLLITTGARVSAFSAGSGGAGGVDVVARSVRVNRHGAILVSAGNSVGGSVTVRSSGSVRVTNGEISAESKDNGGNVRITSGGEIIFFNSTLTGEAARDGGTLTLNPTVVVLDQSTIKARTGERPVEVGLNSQGLLLSESSIQTNMDQMFQMTDVVGGLLDLRAAIPRTEAQLEPGCRDTRDTAESRFFLRPRGGEPQAPGGWYVDMDAAMGFSQAVPPAGRIISNR